MRIVLMGYRAHPYTMEVLDALERRGIRPAALVAARPRHAAEEMAGSPELDDRFLARVRWRDLVSPWALGHLLRSPAASTRVLARILQARRELPDAAGDRPAGSLPVHSVADHGTPACARLLRGLAPDLVLLAPASSILPAEVLGIPRGGVLNAHMGLLPMVRGMDALEWTLLSTGKAWISVHFADPGVDTGDIVMTREVPLGSPFSLADQLVRCRRAMADGLAEAAGLVTAGAHARRPQASADGKQFFRMHPALRELVVARVQGERGP